MDPARATVSYSVINRLLKGGEDDKIKNISNRWVEFSGRRRPQNRLGNLNTSGIVKSALDKGRIGRCLLNETSADSHPIYARIHIWMLHVS
jgi:hypothetical protein